MTELPTGTVTFLFTDIEGSTQLWERHPEAMRAVFARHDSILREAIESHNGRIVKTTGDGFHAAFAFAVEGALAALAAQRNLQFPVVTHPLKVRMALHTGEAEARQGDYYGVSVNRAARLMSIAHGGQILLSTTSAELVRDQLPEGSTLRYLGEHRLRDLVRPERVFQLTALDLPADFPPLKSSDAFASNLPVQLTSFIGREKEMAVVKQLLSKTRLLTLTGPGGTGKTRLSVQLAGQLDEFADGVFFVALAPITEAALVVSAIAEVMKVRDAGGRALLETLKSQLRDKQVLLVLDNFEHVLPAAPVVGELLAAAPRLKVLITSRTILRLAGEYNYPVSPLGLPDPRHLPLPERVAQYEAVRLFTERAQAAKTDFVLTSENASAVAEICARLDGLPLAIELAAARVRLFSPQAMLARLENRLKLLTGGPRDVPARQQTLQDAMAWSHDLLEAGEQSLFARLSVFAGGCTLEAAEAVCNSGDDLPIDVLDGLASLVDKSLLKQEDTGGASRFGMLETIREYALGRLADRGEVEALRQRHAKFYLALAQEADPQLVSAARGVWLRRLKAEHDNLRSALQWAQESGEALTGLQLAGALHWFWYLFGYLSEGRQWADQALAQSQATEAGSLMARAKALWTAGELAWLQGDYAAARPRLEESAALSRALGSSGKRSLAYALMWLGLTIRDQGDSAASRSPLEQSVEIFREIGDAWTLALSLVSLGRARLLSGEADSARSALEEGGAMFRGMGDKLGQALAITNLGLAAARQAEYAQAVVLYKEGLALLWQIEEKIVTVRSLEELARVICAQGDLARATRLFGASESQLEALGAVLPPDACAENDRAVAALPAQLGEAAFTALWAEGRAMTLEQAIGYAMNSEP